jgi:hypothetical protein
MKQEQQFRSLIGRLIREELSEVSALDLSSAAEYVGSEQMNSLLKSILNYQTAEDLENDLKYGLGLPEEAAAEIVDIWADRKRSVSLNEADKKEEDTEDLYLDVDAEESGDGETGSEEVDMDINTSGKNSTEKKVGKGLQMALDAARELPDNETKSKLIRQIGNTALFFLKTQIPTGDQG